MWRGPCCSLGQDPQRHAWGWRLRRRRYMADQPWEEANGPFVVDRLEDA